MRAAPLLVLVACSDYQVRRPGEGDLPPPADIVVHPPAITFPAAQRGTEAVATVRITNAGGSTLDVSRVAIGAGTTFSLPAQVAPFSLEPGESALQEVRYVALGAVDQGFLAVASDDPDDPEVRVPLSGVALVPELTIEPDPLSFGAVSCSEASVVGLRNTGTGALTISGLVLNGAEFTLPAPPVLPAIVAPGEVLPLDVAFAPGPGAVLRVGEVRVESDDPRGVRSGALEGAGVSPPSYVDRFEQVEQDWARLDVLVWVDRSTSMDDDELTLASNFAAFADTMATSGIDWQLVVAVADDGCSEGGVLTPSTPDLEGVLLAAVQAPGGVFHEAGLTVARNALDRAGPGDCNDGFLRAGVTPVAILVADEPEQSVEPWNVIVPDLLADVPALVISAVVGQPGGACAADGVGYHEAVAATGGVDLDFCADWGSSIDQVLGALDPPLSTFALSDTPDPATIVVTVDGVPAAGWTYDPALVAVVFAADALPPPGSTIEVAYDGVSTCS